MVYSKFFRVLGVNFSCHVPTSDLLDLTDGYLGHRHVVAREKIPTDGCTGVFTGFLTIAESV
jgi:hypothetical protein